MLGLFLMFTAITCLWAAELENDYTGSITICFSSDFVGNTRGDINITFEDGIVVTQNEWFNTIAREYRVTNLSRKYWVKDQSWNLNGMYPMNVFQIDTENQQRSNELLRSLQANQDVMFAEPEVQNRLFYTPNDPEIHQQWALEKIQAFEAWDLQQGSPEVLIGIIDSGTKWNHPDLEANIWTNEAEMPGITINWSTGVISGGDGIDNDGNGYVDDVLGWDFYATTSGGTSNNPFQNLSGSTHGTHVAGCAAAVGDNGIGVAGPAFRSKIISTKHSAYNHYDPNGYVYNTYNAVYYMADIGVHVINCSWGGPGNAGAANLAVAYAKDRGTVIIAAAGNDGVNSASTPFYPAAAVDVVGVVSTTNSDVKSGFSNFGVAYDISAPGSNIYSTLFSSSGANTYASSSGTSMASPVAAGVAALIKSQDIRMSVDELIFYLKAGADPIDHINPNHAGRMGVGRINAYNSVRMVPLFSDDLLAFKISGPSTVSQNIPVSFNISVYNAGYGSASNYTINLMSVSSSTPLATVNGPFILPQETLNVNILWTPTEQGLFHIYAEINYNLDENINNNITDFHNVFVLMENVSETVAGNPNSTTVNLNSFINYSANNSLSQSIYYEDELMPGIIQQMTVRFTGVSALVAQGNMVRLYMATTSRQTFSSNTNWIPFDQFTEVFYGELAVNNSGVYDVDILLDNPFEYLGGNLAVMVIKEHNARYGNNNRFQFTTISGQNRTIHWNSNNSSVNTNPFPTATNRIAGITNARFYILNHLDPPQNLESILNEDSVALTWQEPDLDGKILQNYKVYRDGIVLTETAEQNHTDNDLIEGEQYRYWIVAVYSTPNGESPPSNIETIRIPDIIVPPVNLHAVVVNHDIVLTWETEPNETRAMLGYNITRNDTLLTSNPIHELTYKDLNVPKDMEHTYKVMAVYHSGESDFIEQTILMPSYNPPQDLELIGKELVVTLSWKEPATQTFGTLMGYRLYRDNQPYDDIIPTNLLTFTDDDVEIDVEYVYYIKAIWGGEIDGESIPSNSISVTPVVSEDDGTNLSYVTELQGNYPNPFNPETMIRFKIADEGNVNIEIFNIRGQKVRTLVDGFMERGEHAVVWNGRDENGRGVSSGVYFYMMKSESFFDMRRMVLLK